MLKISFLLLMIACNVMGVESIDIDGAIEPVEAITAALTGKFIVVIATLVLVLVGFNYFLGKNDEQQKERLINIMKGAALIGASGSIAAIFG